MATTTTVAEPPSDAPELHTKPKAWPDDAAWLSDHTFSDAVSDDQKADLSRPLRDGETWEKVPKDEIISPAPTIAITEIDDPKHPAHGQRGIFATMPLPPDRFICLYLGHVHTNSMSDTDPHSDYDLSLDRDLGLSVDAAKSGNESRYCNDYRGIAERPNAEFRDCLIQVPSEKRAGGKKWERRVGIFVLSAGKAGKRKAGIRVGEEVLVSYGKGYWEGRKTLAGFRKDEEMLRIAEAALEG